MAGSHQKAPRLDKPSYKYGMVGQQSSDPFSIGPTYTDPTVPVVSNAFGNAGGSGQQAAGPQAMSQSMANARPAVIGNDGGLGQASGQGAFGNLGQSISHAQPAAIGNDGGLGQGIGQGGGGLGQGIGQGAYGHGGGLGQGMGQATQGGFGNDGGLGQSTAGGHGIIGNPSSAAHNPSVIIAGIGAAAGASGVYAATSSPRSSSSRPSTASLQPIGPLIVPGEPQAGYLPANWNANHGYGQAYAGPSTSSDNNNNSGGGAVRKSSVASTQSTYSRTSWFAGDDNPGAGSSSRQQQAHQYQQHPRNAFGRVPPLQVTNTSYEYPSAEAGASSSMDSSAQAPSYDGKGRPLNMHPEKPPLVHLDGGAYQQPTTDRARSENEPPAYMDET